MIDEILSCKTIEDFTRVGTLLAGPSGCKQLELDIAELSLVFSPEDYLQRSELSWAMRSEKNFQHILNKASSQDTSSNVLHYIQLLKQCCPALSKRLSSVLRKATY